MSVSYYDEIFNELTERKHELAKRLRATDMNIQTESLSQSTGELSQYDNHPADTATDLYEREKDLALINRDKREYNDIERALEKIENGTFGICESTGQEIPYERLKANPTAKTITEFADGAQKVDNESRPVEEDVLEGFHKYNFDGKDEETEFDAEDAYQSVARFNETSMVYEGSSLDDADELIGSVEQIEGFLSTNMEGYKGADSVKVEQNIHYDQYVDDP